MGGAVDAEWNADAPGNDKSRQRDGEREADAVADDIADGAAQVEGFAKVALGEAGDPGDEALINRTIQGEKRAQCVFHSCRFGVAMSVFADDITGDEITGGGFHDQEAENCDQKERRQDGGYAAKDVSAHGN